MRVTLIALDGDVLADSEMATLADVAKMDNHRDRPEVIRAIASGEGESQRESVTFKETVFVFRRAGGRGRQAGRHRADVAHVGGDP